MTTNATNHYYICVVLTIIPFLYSIADLRAKTDSYQKIRSLITVCNYLANFLISLVEIGRPPTHVLPASFYYHWSMFPHHHVIEVEDDDDDMELQSEGEGNGTYSATVCRFPHE